MSTTCCQPLFVGPETGINNAFIEKNIILRNIHLEPLTTIPTGIATQTPTFPTPGPLTGPDGAVQTDISESAFDSIVGASGPYTGIGGAAASTVIAASVFDSIISAASTETGIVSAITGSTAPVTTATPVPMGQTSTTSGFPNSSATSSPSMSGSTSSSMVTSTAGSSSPAAVASPSPTSGANRRLAIPLFVFILWSLLVNTIWI